jgi:mRNA interferase MazF
MVAKKKASYVPDRGDIVWLDFDPVRGHEQKGHQPAYVVSPKVYNEKKDLVLVCPIASKKKVYSFEVPLLWKMVWVVLSDHIWSIDWIDRKAKHVEKASEDVIQEVVVKLVALISG